MLACVQAPPSAVSRALSGGGPAAGRRPGDESALRRSRALVTSRADPPRARGGPIARGHADLTGVSAGKSVSAEQVGECWACPTAVSAGKSVSADSEQA